MSTIALRPPFIWGEGAPSIGHIAHAFHEGRFVWIGSGQFAYSVCHVDNLASAVVCSVDRGQGGKAYFVTDDDVTTMRQFFTDVIEATGQPSKARVVPYWFGVLLARKMGLVFAVFRPGKQPPLTLETVRLIGNRIELSNALAKRELGYAPKVSRSAGISRMRAAAGISSVGARPSARASAAALTVALLALATAATPNGQPTFYDSITIAGRPAPVRADIEDLLPDATLRTRSNQSDRILWTAAALRSTAAADRRR